MKEKNLPITNIMIDDWVYLKEVNVDSPIVMCRLTLQHLQKIVIFQYKFINDV